MKTPTPKQAPSRRSRSPERGPDNTTMTVSMRKELREAIEVLAKAEGRTYSSYIRLNLAKLVGDMSLAS